MPVASHFASQVATKKGAENDLFGPLNLCARGVGAYLFLLCESWLETPRATLPDDDHELARLAKVSIQEWRALAPYIRPKLCLDQQTKRLYDPRLMEESLKQASHSVRGKRGGHAKARKKPKPKV
jgi:uncharacterized protein YdaU (DUF1376 family)